MERRRQKHKHTTLNEKKKLLNNFYSIPHTVICTLYVDAIQRPTRTNVMEFDNKYEDVLRIKNT